MRKRQLTIAIFAALATLKISAQTDDYDDGMPAGTLLYEVSAQGSGSIGDHTPLWLNANKYGLSSLNTRNGYIRASVSHPMTADKNIKKWDFGYGVDVAVASGYTSKFIVQQLYAEGRWLNGTLTIGSKQYGMELKNSELSSGSQTLGINARPVPQVRIALPDYWDIPFTKGWLGLKGHIAFGKTTDDNWQTDFTSGVNKYTKDALYHSKAGYIRIGKGGQYHPVSLELGLEMGCQFGGKSYNVTAVEGGAQNVVDNGSGLKAFWEAFCPGGSDATESQYQNVAGNQLGSWVFRLNFDYDSWYLGLYGDHFFEDHSAMFLLDYDGYGHGEEWNEKKKSRFLLYDLKDIMLGAELKLKNSKAINDIVFEYIYTKYQSGPIYHDHTQHISDHIGGMDDYYNHSIFTGWQHWGQVMGNPLYLSPLYNNDGTIRVENNRFYAFHLGVSGNPTEQLNYRFLASWQKGFGTYIEPYEDPKQSLNLMAEAVYAFPNDSKAKGWSIKAAYGIDLGTIHGNNYGLQITIAKQGLLNLKGKNK